MYDLFDCLQEELSYDDEEAQKLLQAVLLMRAQRDYEVARQNFCGLLGRMRAAQAHKERQKLGTDPTKVASFAITGKSNVPEVQHVKGTKKLTDLAYTLLDQLANLVHRSLKKVPYQFRLIVGLSGGADSVLLLVLAARLYEKYNYSVQAVHCIHGLDPDDAIWYEHNVALCQRLDVELITPKLNIVYGNGVSPEDASRKERYRALLEAVDAAHKDGLDAALMLGHQADDQIESFILALKRGSGPVGLAGMQFLVEDQRGIILRPLLDLHKNEVEQILQLLDIPYVYDLSNSYLKFERNFVRLKVIPQLRERFPGVEGAILRSQKLCAYEHELSQRLVKMQLKTMKVGPKILDFSLMDLSDKALATILVRTFLTEALAEPCAFNVVEQTLVLMEAGHDRNGLITVETEQGTLAISTFLNYLCVYEPLTAEDEKSLSGCYELKVGQVLTVGSYRYQLVASYISNLHGMVSRGYLYGSRRDTLDLSCLPEDKRPDEKQRYFYLGTEERVVLDFSYSRGQAIKLRSCRHARPIKKLLIEAGIAPWRRQVVPLVKSVAGEILALGTIGAVAPQPLCPRGDTIYCYELHISPASKAQAQA